jgi:ligand-binding SRPBCC domain-containing protein
MPCFETSQDFAFPLGRVFDVFTRPANLARVMPPELHFRVIEAPERLELGSRVTVQGRRWGLGQRVTSEVTAFEAEVRFVQEQVCGPFRRWAHRHEFEALPDGGTRVCEAIDFEPPGGLLGLQLTAAAVERELGQVFAYRKGKWAELLGS